jgi:hypothetical protein
MRGNVVPFSFPIRPLGRLLKMFIDLQRQLWLRRRAQMKDPHSPLSPSPLHRRFHLTQPDSGLKVDQSRVGMLATRYAGSWPINDRHGTEEDGNFLTKKIGT